MFTASYLRPIRISRKYIIVRKNENVSIFQKFLIFLKIHPPQSEPKGGVKAKINDLFITCFFQELNSNIFKE